MFGLQAARTASGTLYEMVLTFTALTGFGAMWGRL